MKHSITRHSGVSSALTIAAFTLAVAADASAQVPAEVEAVVAAYHEALAAGDSVAALALLADDVVILESGGIETKEQYRSGTSRETFASLKRSRGRGVR
jgi:ketosteroid isomerase-like protein